MTLNEAMNGIVMEAAKMIVELIWRLCNALAYVMQFVGFFGLVAFVGIGAWVWADHVDREVKS